MKLNMSTLSVLFKADVSFLRLSHPIRDETEVLLRKEDASKT